MRETVSSGNGEPSAPQPAGARPHVYAVMPVYNRLAMTEACLTCLSAQSYPALRIIVVDGGSTDGTPEQIRRRYPGVDVLEGKKELWWGEAMHLGIDYSLHQSRQDDDMVLMMNNDTLIDADYVETLVRVSQERKAAVGGVIVDSSDPSRVLDAGEFIDWDSYSFPVNTAHKPGETYVEGVDLLSGRGTLVPLAMVRAAGNVNGARFPHYIADCEFFSRLKRKGFRLGVTWETTIRSHVDVTGLSAHHAGPLTLSQVWQALLSKRSMDNVRNHWRFIEDCAPTRLQRPLKRRLIRRCAYLVASRTALRHVALPLAWFVSGLYFVTEEDCVACGCDTALLVKTGVLKPWRHHEWFLLDEGSRSRIAEDPRLRRLYGRAWNPLTKMTRWIRAKRHGHASSSSHAATREPASTNRQTLL